MRTTAILIVMGLSFGVMAQETKPILYNMATSGLYLRSQPKSQSRVITKVPYGTKMEVEERTGITGKSGWIEDEWLKVHFRGRTGYVFAGYLSKMKAPAKQKTSGKLTESLVAYAESTFSKTQEATETLDGKMLHCYQPFNGQIELETETQDGWTTASLILPTEDLFDAYVLLEALLYWNDELSILDSIRFVKGKDGKIRKISDGQGRVRISKVSEDRVQLSLSDQAE